MQSPTSLIKDKRKIEKADEVGKSVRINKKERKPITTEGNTIKILNLSTHQLLIAEHSLLGKGLGFAPTIGPNKFGLFKDLNKFIRNLTVKRFYAKDQIDSSNPMTSGIVATNTDSAEDLIQQDALVTLMELWDDGSPDIIPCDIYDIPDVVHTGFRPKSTFFPSACKGPDVETYYQATYRDLLNLCDTKSSSHPNLSGAEHSALSTLKDNLLVIKQADKGESLVVQDKTD